MKNARGFTLLELMVAVAVASISLTVGVPSMVSTIANNRLTAQSNAFLTSLAMARSEAVKSGKDVTICRTATGGATCDTGTGGWNKGWAVIPTGDDAVLVAPALRGNNTLTGGTGLTDALTFNSQGFPSTNGSFLLCDGARSGYAREIEVNVTGRARVIRYDGDATGCQ